MNVEPHATRRSLLSRPPLWRLAVLVAAGIALVILAVMRERRLRPEELPPEQSVEGLRMVQEVLSAVADSDFGRSPRGKALTGAAAELVAQGRVRFSPSLEVEALYRKEFLREPVLYISTARVKDHVLWPRRAELAERLYHESLHVVVGRRGRCIEEECDAFCAAEEAAAAVTQRRPRFPVMRDGKTVWKWVQEAYPSYRNDPAYRPIGCTVEELAANSGVVRPPQR